MKKLLASAAVSFILAAGLSDAVAKDDKVIYFDYDEFLAIRSLDPNMQEARLCGLNKMCMRFWKNGEMMVPEHAMVVRADFDGDGTVDTGVAMEKDKPEGQEGLDFFIMAATKEKNVYKLMQTISLPTAHTIVEVYWDEIKKQIGIDTGERQVTSESTVFAQADGKLVGGFKPKSGMVESRLTYLRWNAKEKKFDVLHGTVKS